MSDEIPERSDEVPERPAGESASADRASREQARWEAAEVLSWGGRGPSVPLQRPPKP